jgi:hypothetical protein
MEPHMEAIVLFVLLIIGLATLGGASLTWHPDTHEQWPTDATR